MTRTPRSQLRAFYASIGITGSAARKAIAHDLRLARYNYADQNRAICAELGRDVAWARLCTIGLHNPLAAGFLFELTPQGLDYWAQRAYTDGAQ